MFASQDCRGHQMLVHSISATRKVRVLHSPSDGPPPLVLALEAEQLAAAGKESTALGQQALLLASRIASSSFDTAGALASMSRELTAVMD